MKTVELKITKEDLLGEYFDVHDCPIARAFKRNFPDIKITVGSGYITNRNTPFRAYIMYTFDGYEAYCSIMQNKEFTLILNEIV